MDDQLLKHRVLVCARCGKRRETHLVVNYSNGNLIYGTVLVCPTATYRALAAGKPEKAKKQKEEEEERT